ncbi:uncharacterized protein LOC118338446 [Morone saxatilis]|uniref:uncharacterized protein LOC118338446 n=1 Tax=Morone saxatilis TaxID=34816 RepID=UPI0015E23620|nr:uncharacterized protein LOC118338446 [Morone saxatilis]
MHVSLWLSLRYIFRHGNGNMLSAQQQQEGGAAQFNVLRYRALYANTNRNRNTFYPQAITLTNSYFQSHSVRNYPYACLQIPSTLVNSSEELQPSSALRSELHRGKRRFKMLCSRCVLPFLALYMLLEEISAAVLPSIRNKREVNWLDQELFPRLLDRSDQRDLSVGDDGKVGRDVDGRPSHSETFVAPTEQLSFQRQSQYQYQRKANEKRRKVAPLDSIGGFQMSSFRNRNDEPDIHWEEFRE